MQEVYEKESNRNSPHSNSHSGVHSQSWWNSTGSQVPQNSLSKSVSLTMDSSRQDCPSVKQFGFQLQDQDSSSSQSTGQSHNEISNMGANNRNGQCISVHSGYEETYGKQVEAHMKSVLSLGTPDFVYPTSQIDYSQSVSVARIPYPYVDPYFGGLMTAYGPQGIIHPQMMGMAPARVPLPLDVSEDEPIFVNAKQYRGILRRRQSRAKLEAQNRLIRDRKPYLHESRHLHALKRARGSGGRFLNTKTLQQSEHSPTSDVQNASDSASLQLSGNASESEFGNTGACTTSCSDISRVSNNDIDIFHQQDFRFSGYPYMGVGGSQQHRVPVSQ